MKRSHILMFALFAICAIAIALHPLYANEPPFAPLAVCKDGKCVMDEKDYQTYRAWHFALIERVQKANEQAEELSNEVQSLEARLARNAYCQGRKS